VTTHFCYREPILNHIDQLQKGRVRNIALFVVWGLISFVLVFGIETVNYLIVKPRVDSTPELAKWTKNITKA